MTLVHRALFTWFIVLVFLILLCLRLDPRTHWSWWVTFIPLWIFDGILLVYVIIKIIRKWRNLKRLKELLMHYYWYIGGVLLKIASQLMICITLEYPKLGIPLYATMMPLWTLLTGSIIYVFRRLNTNDAY